MPAPSTLVVGGLPSRTLADTFEDDFEDDEATMPMDIQSPYADGGAPPPRRPERRELPGKSAVEQALQREAFPSGFDYGEGEDYDDEPTVMMRTVAPEDTEPKKARRDTTKRPGRRRRSLINRD